MQLTSAPTTPTPSGGVGFFFSPFKLAEFTMVENIIITVCVESDRLPMIEVDVSFRCEIGDDVNGLNVVSIDHNSVSVPLSQLRGYYSTPLERWMHGRLDWLRFFEKIVAKRLDSGEYDSDIIDDIESRQWGPMDWLQEREDAKGW